MLFICIFTEIPAQQSKLRDAIGLEVTAQVALRRNAGLEFWCFREFLARSWPRCRDGQRTSLLYRKGS